MVLVVVHGGRAVGCVIFSGGSRCVFHCESYCSNTVTVHGTVNHLINLPVCENNLGPYPSIFYYLHV